MDAPLLGKPIWTIPSALSPFHQMFEAKNELSRMWPRIRHGVTYGSHRQTWVRVNFFDLIQLSLKSFDSNSTHDSQWLSKIGSNQLTPQNGFLEFDSNRLMPQMAFQNFDLHQLVTQNAFLEFWFKSTYAPPPQKKLEYWFQSTHDSIILYVLIQ